MLSVDSISKTPLELISISTAEKSDIGANIIKTMSYKKFPINIILFPYNRKDDNYKYIYLATFNDGAIYSKRKLSDKNWEGPIRNSYYDKNDKYIPFRTLAISDEGKLLGVAYDGNVYVKKDEDTAITNLHNRDFGESFKNEWIKYHLNDLDLIQILLINNRDAQNNISKIKISYIGVKTDGSLNKLNYNKEQKGLTFDYQIYEKNNAPIYSISLDNEEHMLIINQNRELKRTVNTLSKILNDTNIGDYDFIEDTNNKDTKKFINPSILYDIIYSQDGKLYGIGGLNKQITLLKQSNIHFLQPFSTLDKNPNITLVIPENYIVKYKSNYILDQYQEPKINSLEESYDKELNEDTQKFKLFCKSQFPNDYIDIEMIQKIDEFQDKIKNLEKVKNDLINIDKIKSIQD